METFVISYFHVWVPAKFSFQEEKALATISVCADENVGSWLCSLKFVEESVLSLPHTPASFTPLQPFREGPSPVSCYNIDDEGEVFYYAISSVQEFFENNNKLFWESDVK